MRLNVQIRAILAVCSLMLLVGGVWTYINLDRITLAIPLDSVRDSDSKLAQFLNSYLPVDRSPDKNPLMEDPDIEPDGDLIRAGEGSVNGKYIHPVRAAFVSLVRNSELSDIKRSMLEIEESFNNKFHYPWIFFNDEEFTESFKKKISEATSAEVQFVKLDPSDWEEPSWIDYKKAEEGQNQLEQEHVGYAKMQSYHRMCRWYSGPFFMNPVLDNYQYYWRIEPKTRYYCDIDYDVFAYMEDNEKDYGFVINLFDSPQSVRTLWPTAKKFFFENPQYVAENNTIQWLLQETRKDHNDIANGYSTCHFWSNFEIGSLEFFRSKRYQDYFKHLDTAGGFFYERWGDAPVHSVALAMMADYNRIHWFKDIGYFHAPYSNCPKTSKCRGCEAGEFTAFGGLYPENCMPEWLKAAGAE